MEKIKFVALLLFVCALFSGFSTQTSDAKYEVVDESAIEDPGYLSEEEVFEALAYTYNDVELLKKINLQKTKTPSNSTIVGFHTEDYSKYTNNQYAGMYVDENRNLVICYKSNSDTLNRMEKLNSKNSGRLISTSNKVIANSVSIKGVKYSLSELMEIYDYLIQNADQCKGIKEIWVDYKSNKVTIGIFTIKEAEVTKKELLSLFGEDAILFVESNPDDVIKEVVNINRTT